jgi:hypothetical protein
MFFANRFPDNNTFGFSTRGTLISEWKRKNRALPILAISLMLWRMAVAVTVAVTIAATATATVAVWGAHGPGAALDRPRDDAGRATWRC